MKPGISTDEVKANRQYKDKKKLLTNNRTLGDIV